MKTTSIMSEISPQCTDIKWKSHDMCSEVEEGVNLFKNKQNEGSVIMKLNLGP